MSSRFAFHTHTQGERREKRKRRQEREQGVEGKGIKRSEREEVNHAELSNTPIKYAAAY